MTIYRLAYFLRAMLIVGGALAATIWFAVTRGQDFNWDQQNYHITAPFLLSHGTFWRSIAPSGIQSYFDPLALQAQFQAMRHLSPIGFAVTLAVIQSLAFMIGGAVCVDIARPAGEWKALIFSLLGFALCLMAPMALSEAGTTFIDLATAVPVLLAYFILLTRGHRLGLSVSGLAAGALLGVATGFKLTNGVFAFGVLGFAMAGRDTLRQRLNWLILCGAAAVAGFVVLSGDWYFTVWKRFGNPFFPFYNNIFHSPDVAWTAIRDPRFISHSVLDFWRYPVYWLVGGSPTPGIGSPSSEVVFHDLRWIIAIAGCTIVLGLLLVLRQWRRMRLTDPATGLLFAFVVAYTLWLAEFGYHRYMLPLDILCGPVLLWLAMLVRPDLLGMGLSLAAVGLSWWTMVVPDWGHIPWKPYWATINPIPVDFGAPSIIFLTDHPMGFIVASLPANAIYVNVDGSFNMRADSTNSLSVQLKQELATKDILLKEVDRGIVPSGIDTILAGYGLATTDRCQPLVIAVVTFRICDVIRQQ